MLKYFIWIIRLAIPIVYHYVTWIFRYSLNPSKYPLRLRYNRVRGLVLTFIRIVKVDPIISNKLTLRSDKRYYLIGNHVSFFDPVMMIAINEEPITFASKIETLKYPLVGRIIKILGGVFLERDNLKQEIKVMQTIKTSLSQGLINWAIFPEGTRNQVYGSPMNEFKAGSFKLASQTNTTIVPLAIWGSQVVLSKHTRWQRYPIFIHYLDPVEPANFDHNSIKIAEHCQKLVQTEIDKMRDEHPELVKIYSKGREYIKYLH